MRWTLIICIGLAVWSMLVKGDQDLPAARNAIYDRSPNDTTFRLNLPASVSKDELWKLCR